MTTQLRVALWRVPTIVAGSDIEATVMNMISQYTHEQRLDLLRDGVDQALTHFGVAPPGTKVINVFVVPEYFFAYSHRLHFVDEHTKDLTISGLKEISKRGNTLLFPGTVAWIKTMKKGNSFTSVFQSSRYNRAIDRITKTRDLFDPPKDKKPSKPLSVQTIEKARKGDIAGTMYYAQNTAWVMRGGEVLLKYHKRMNGSEINQADLDHMKANGDTVVWVPGARSGTFTVDNIAFGLEICAEHDGGALQQTMTGKVADVHVVISATMSVQPDKRGHVRDGGYLVHCDAVKAPSVHRKQAGGFNPITPGTTAAKPLLSGAEIAARTQSLQDHAAAKKKSDAARDAQIAEMTAYAGGTIHYYQLTV
jgi:predicted amidohydrolase